MGCAPRVGWRVGSMGGSSCCHTAWLHALAGAVRSRRCVDPPPRGAERYANPTPSRNRRTTESTTESHSVPAGSLDGSASGDLPLLVARDERPAVCLQPCDEMVDRHTVELPGRDGSRRPSQGARPGRSCRWRRAAAPAAARSRTRDRCSRALARCPRSDGTPPRGCGGRADDRDGPRSIGSTPVGARMRPGAPPPPTRGAQPGMPCRPRTAWSRSSSVVSQVMSALGGRPGRSMASWTAPPEDTPDGYTCPPATVVR